MLDQHASNFVEERIGDLLDGRLCGVELHLLQNDDFGLGHANSRRATILRRIRIGLALLVRARVLVVANRVAVRIARTTVCRRIVCLQTLDVDTRIFRIDHTVFVTIWRTTILRPIRIRHALDVLARIFDVDDAVAISIRRTTILGRIRIGHTSNLHACIFLVDNAVVVRIRRAAILRRIRVRHALDVPARIFLVEDPVLVRIRRRRRLRLLRARRIREHADRPHGGCTNTRRKTRTSTHTNLEVVHEAVPRIEQNFHVRRAIQRRVVVIVQDKPSRSFGTNLQVSAGEQNPNTGTDVQRRSLRRARRTTVNERATKIGTEIERPHEIVLDATTSDHLHQRPRPFAHERAFTRIARRQPNVATNSQLEWIPVVTNQIRARAKPQIPTLHSRRRHELQVISSIRTRTCLHQRDRVRDVDRHLVAEGKSNVQVQKQLIADDSSNQISIRCFEKQRILRIIEKERCVRRQFTRNVRRLHAKHPVTRGRRRKAVQG